jgi:hypothetical protein
MKKMILWKLNSIWMEILNDIACNLNWIEIQWDANWWRRYWKSTCEYGVGKKKKN